VLARNPVAKQPLVYDPGDEDLPVLVPPEPQDGLPTGPAVTVAIGSMNAKTKVATIECSTCAALLEVYPQNVPGEPSLGWDVLDDGELCKAPPLRRCPRARAEIKLRFPAFEG